MTAKKKPVREVPVDPLLGDENFVKVEADPTNERYLVSFTDKIFANDAFVRFELKKPLGPAMSWDGEAKAFAVKAVDYEKLKSGVERAREIVGIMTRVRQDMEDTLAFDLGGGDIRFLPAFTKSGERCNGEILSVNRFYIAQFSNEKDGIKYVRVHSADKFMHTQDDWNNVEAALSRRFSIGEKVSILYGEKSKAQVQDYVPRQRQAQSQSM